MPWTHSNSIFAKDFKPKPYWWEAFQPAALPEVQLPKSVPVVIVGAGYTGLNAALELSRHGIESVMQKWLNSALAHLHAIAVWMRTAECMHFGGRVVSDRRLVVSALPLSVDKDQTHNTL